MEVAIGPYLMLMLVLSIGLIVYLTARVKLHPFLGIVVATYVYGLGTNLIGSLLDAPAPVIPNIAKVMTDGFGGILGSIGLVIIFGTVIGKLMELSGAAVTLAEFVLKRLGKRHPALAMSIVGWVVSIPVFCDSGYVILSPLQKSIARKTGTNPVVLGTALATGLYASHTFVPPTPGPIAAAGNVGIGPEGLIWVILFGILVSSFAATAGYFWATRMTRGLSVHHEHAQQTFEEYKAQFKRLPSAFAALLPIVLPIVLMALGSIAGFPAAPAEDGSAQTLITGTAFKVLTFVGAPVNALFIGVIAAFVLLVQVRNESTLTGWVSSALLDAAGILIITGAGGAFGAMIKATPMAGFIQSLIQGQAGMTGVGALVILFLISALLKTAQGSSTAALIITSSIALPLLPILGLDGSWGTIPTGQVLAVMAIAAGAMVVSHVNDSYFWVVSQFSGMSLPTAYRAHTAATLVQGLVALTVTLVLGALLL